MNVSYNSALRQSKALRADLDRLATQPATSPLTPSDIGNVSASLTGLAKTIDEYNHLARQELIPKKQEEAFERVRRFRNDLADSRQRVEALKRQREDAIQVDNRAELFGRRPYAAATPENPYANATTTGSGLHARGASIGGGAGGLGLGSSDEQREAHALREQTFFSGANAALDEYIARGQVVLGDLGSQREMLKNTQRRIYSVANTLGVSGDTIRMVERRAREDKWIFWGCVVVFVLFCWLCLHFLR